MKVLNFGSLNIDFVYRLDHIVNKGETISSDGLSIFSGGKGLNQSVAMGRAGIEVYHAGSVGSDGDFLVDILRNSGVNVDNIVFIDSDRTGNAIIQIDKDGDNCIILYGGANRAVTKEQVDNTLSMFSDGDFIVLQNEINEMPYIVEKAHERGLKIVLNPSPMDDKIFELPLAYVDYFILNEIELAQLLKMEKIDYEDIDKIVPLVSSEFKDASVILTLGDKGSVYINDNKYYFQKAFKTEVVDTTAAGDTFSGYFVASIIGGKSIEESMERASKAAAIAVSRNGAAPSIPYADEVEKFGA